MKHTFYATKDPLLHGATVHSGAQKRPSQSNLSNLSDIKGEQGHFLHVRMIARRLVRGLRKPQLRHSSAGNIKTIDSDQSGKQRIDVIDAALKLLSCLIPPN